MGLPVDSLRDAGTSPRLLRRKAGKARGEDRALQLRHPIRLYDYSRCIPLAEPVDGHEIPSAAIVFVDGSLVDVDIKERVIVVIERAPPNVGWSDGPTHPRP